jgi:hypothetical protein
MTQRKLLRITIGVIALYSVAIAAGILLRIRYPGAESPVYETYRDLIPLIIATPAAFLAFSFQRRMSYVQALRSLWTMMAAAVQGARAYARTEAPTRELYEHTLARLSISIEEARAVFQNIAVPGDEKGWYPFEPIKQIHDQVRELGFGARVDTRKRALAGANIDKMWKAVREQLLREFDRDVPTYHHSWYVALKSTDESSRAGRMSGRES